MKYPNFFIVGAAKSGTSSLWQYLKNNDEVFMPSDELYKEPSFFSYIGEGMGLQSYLNIFKDATKEHRLIGEASTAYLTDPDSAGKIHAFNPEAKIIIMLRNPADRAYSLYRWMVQEGYEHAGTFERALEIERKRINKKIPNFFEPQYYYNYLYFNSGLYYEQVKRYLDLFGDSVLVIKFDDFKNDLEKTYEEICGFLGIKSNKLSFSVHNVSKDVFHPKIQFVLRVINNYLIRFKKPETKEARDWLLSWGIKNSRPPRLKKQTRDILIKKYIKDIKLLAKLTKINYDSWLKENA